MVFGRNRRSIIGGREVRPDIAVINYPGGNSNFTKEIWAEHGSPTDVALGDGWSSIRDFTFVDSDLQKIKIPTSVTSIGNAAFENTLKLVSVTFNPDSELKTIGENAFKDAKALTTIEIPSGVETINFATFASAIKLTSVTFRPNSRLKIIDMYAFSNTDLRTIDIPKSVQDIRSNAFYGNANLTTIRTYPIVLDRLNADDLNLQAHFGINNFDENNMFFGIDHPVNIISMVDTQGGRRKPHSRTRKRGRKKTTQRRRIKRKTRRRKTKQRK